MTPSPVTLVPATAEQAGGWLRAATARHDGGVIVHVAGASEDLPRLAGVIEAIDGRAAFDQLVLDAGAGPATASTLADLDAAVPVLRLDCPPGLPDDVRSSLEDARATVLVVHADDEAGLCAALAAARLGISVVRVGDLPGSPAGRIIARLADLLLTRVPLEPKTAPGAATPERVCVIGNPLVELVQRHARAALHAAAWRELGVSPGGYSLVALTGALPFAALEGRLRELESRFPLVLEAPPGYDVPGARIVSEPTFLKRLSLERAAKAIFTDSARVVEEAAVLGVPCHALAAGSASVCAAPAGQDVARWDRDAGRRAADAIITNFARVRLPG